MFDKRYYLYNTWSNLGHIDTDDVSQLFIEIEEDCIRTMQSKFKKNICNTYKLFLLMMSWIREQNGQTETVYLNNK